MDTMHGGMDFTSLELSTQTSEPYVLAWPLGDGVDGDAECSTMAVMKREGGVLLMMPGAFLPQGVVDQGNSGADGLVWPIFQVRSARQHRRSWCCSPDRNNAFSFGGGLFARGHPSTQAFCRGRGDLLRIRRRLSLCSALSGCFDAYGQAMACRFARLGSLLHSRRAGSCRRGRTRDATAEKKSAQKGYFFRRYAGIAATEPGRSDPQVLRADCSAVRAASDDGVSASSSRSISSSKSLTTSADNVGELGEIFGSTSKNCCASDPWFIGSASRPSACRTGGVGGREAGCGCRAQTSL